MTFIILDRKNVLIGCTVISLIFGLGIIIGYVYNGSNYNLPVYNPHTEKLYVTQDQFSIEKNLVKDALDNVSPKQIRAYLKKLTEEPHIAGHDRDEELTKWIEESWIKMGLDHVELATYDFYLNWPNSSNPNKIYILDDEDQVIFTSKHKEEPLIEGDSGANFIDAFIAYSPAGIAEGDLVYVHFGRVEDLRKLKNMGIDINGKICMARYGKIFRGNKLKHCQDAGAIGMILFSDPADVAIQGTKPENVYPNTIFLPGTGIQRGNAFVGFKGDKLSPGWASIPNAYRMDPEDQTFLPKIPAQPIGYFDAKVILENMGGSPVPNEWNGGIENITYNLGGSMKNGFKIRLSTHNYFGNKKSSNVIGYIKGAVEPDRYVMLSNHRDAWGYGAVDPSSGTAQLMEVARTFGKMMKKGWRPRRTIVLLSFATEEYGIEGSTEWVQHHTSKLMQRTVGLVNTDICVSGPIIRPQSSPVLADSFMRALKIADNPTESEHTNYYDFWYNWINLDKENNNKTNDNATLKEPIVKLLGSGSDHAPFNFFANIPAINLRFKDDNKKYQGLGTYPMYHTGYETFFLMDNLIDPGFKIHKTCTQTALHILLELADSAILPYSLEKFPMAIQETLDYFDQNNVTVKLQNGGVTLQHIKDAVNEFENATKRYMENLEKIKNDMDPIKLRIVNDQMMQLERIFNMPNGVPGRPETRNAIFANSKFNTYGASAFPGITDLLHEIEDLDDESKKKRYQELKRHVSDLMIMIKEASRFLLSPEII